MFKSDSKFVCNSILLTVQLTVQTCKVHVNCLFLIKLCKQSQNKWIGYSLFTITKPYFKCQIQSAFDHFVDHFDVYFLHFNEMQ